MSCGTTVENALRGVPGVERAEASFANANATVSLPIGSSVKVEDLISAVEDMGFGCELAPPTLVLDVEGMMCQVSVQSISSGVVAAAQCSFPFLLLLFLSSNSRHVVLAFAFGCFPLSHLF